MGRATDPVSAARGAESLLQAFGRGHRALMGLKNARGKDQPMWCLFCHPEHRYLDAVWSGLRGWATSLSRTSLPRSPILPVDPYYAAGRIFMQYP